MAVAATSGHLSEQEIAIPMTASKLQPPDDGMASFPKQALAVFQPDVHLLQLHIRSSISGTSTVGPKGDVQARRLIVGKPAFAWANA